MRHLRIALLANVKQKNRNEYLPPRFRLTHFNAE